MGVKLQFCRKCDTWKDIERFGKDTNRKNGRYPTCKDCVSESNKAYYISNSDKIKNRNSEAYNKLSPEGKYQRGFVSRLKYKFGLTIDDYNILLTDQLGLCANPGCRNEPLDERYWCLYVDHDHAHCPGKKSCGKCIRGLLCRDCNQALGFVHDDVKRLLGLVDYLESYRRGDGVDR